MYATKSPSLRINQADLKCKNGCGYYGTTEWGGYCSICYRNSLQTEKHRKYGHRSDNSKASVPGFSKFEEKKRQQSDKGKKYLKTLAVFRKPSSAKDTGRPDIHQELKKSNSELLKLKAEYSENYGYLGLKIEREIYALIDSFCKKMKDDFEQNKTIDELGEMAQKGYKIFAREIENNPHYEHVSPEIREQLLDFIEKSSMTYLYKILFCPPTTLEEDKDLAIQNRIRALSWVNAHNLDCRISERSVEVRELVYTAITELINLDSVKAPQDKLACIVKCCQSVVLVLQQCQGGPVSADEFLPALIFVVLKANPARLKSNIHYITRFCNDARLLQGEGGYYFTNLCCAVSFIENLTAESLNMSEEEFSACMSGKVTIVSAWESALVACESMHQLCEHLSLLKTLNDRNTIIQEENKTLSDDIEKFQEDIKNQVAAAIAKNPLELKPLKTPVSLDKIDLIPDTLPPPISPTIKVELAQTKTETLDNQGEENSTEMEGNFYAQNLQLQPLNLGDEIKKKKNMTLDVCGEESEMKNSDSSEFLSPSPVFKFESFENNSFDMLTTPDESFLMGLSNINYDIEFSDISGENSINEDPSPVKSQKFPLPRDPFSPVDNNTFLITQEPLKPLNIKPSTSNNNSEENPVVDPSNNNSLIDNVGAGTPENLPSPIKPEYTGFSRQGWQIPSIPCNTGDYSSLTVVDSQTLLNDQPVDESKDQQVLIESDKAQGTDLKEEVLEKKDAEKKEDSLINNDDGAVRILGGVLETLDKLF